MRSAARCAAEMRGHSSAVICTCPQSSSEDQARWNSPPAPAGVESRICCAAGAAASIGEIIFANSPSIVPAKTGTSAIPIVIMSGDDPVRLGFVASLNRPGGNTTGVAILSNELAAKRLALLHEMLPEAKTVAVLINSDFGPSGRSRNDIEAAAPALGLVVRFLQANSEAEIDAAFASLATAHADALLVGPGPFLDSRRNLLVERAGNAAIPASYETRATALAGGLMSYGS